MRVACRLAGLSALETYYADVNRRANKPMRQGRICKNANLAAGRRVTGWVVREFPEFRLSWRTRSCCGRGWLGREFFRTIYAPG
jgi:hypothetical protein